jgi:hypothetical protein
MLTNTTIESSTTLTPEDLKEKLRLGPTNFSFQKKDGTIRNAYGTLLMSEIPEDQHPKSGSEASPKIIPFFDLEKSAWRSVGIEQPIFAQ